MNKITSDPVPNAGILDIFDCCVAFSQEKVPENGEDSFYYAINEVSAVASVFDGCGGAGAKRYALLNNKTGAYIASRAIGGAVRTWFLESCIENASDRFETLRLKRRIQECLQVCKSFDSDKESRFKGTMAKEFPSTLAAVVCSQKENQLFADIFWAGDSRGYLLNADGLFLLTKDDLVGVDLYEDYSCDGVMSNVVSASKDFEIHNRRVPLEKSGIVFTATDGCFGYFSTPMEFEFSVIETLLKASGPKEWECSLKNMLGEYASDDYTFCALAFGYDSFEQMRIAFVTRANFLHKKYIQNLPGCSEEEKKFLWNQYRDEFLKYINC
jgi:hypothetical protein